MSKRKCITCTECDGVMFIAKEVGEVQNGPIRAQDWLKADGTECSVGDPMQCPECKQMYKFFIRPMVKDYEVH